MAVPLLKQLPLLGHKALSQTVFRDRVLKVDSILLNVPTAGILTRIHGGIRSVVKPTNYLP